MFKKYKVISSTKLTVGVFGANGNVGRATIVALSHYFSSAISIRAIVRNPISAKFLADFKGVHIMYGEVGNTDCSQSLIGLNSIFIIPPPVENRIERTKITIKLAQDCKIKHIVTISLTVADDDSIFFGKEFSELENYIKNTCTSYSILRLPLFVDNFWILKKTLPKIRLTLDRDKYFTPVVIADIGLAAAYIIAQSDKHLNKSYTITSDRINIDLVVEYFSQLFGSDVEYEKIDFEESKQFMLENGIEPWQIDSTAELARLINEGSSLLDQKENDFQAITSQEPTKVRDWIANAKAYFLS